MIHRWHIVSCACMGLLACESSKKYDVRDREIGSGGTGSMSQASGAGTGATGGSGGVSSGVAGVTGADPSPGGASGDSGIPAGGTGGFDAPGGAAGQAGARECSADDDCAADPECGDGAVSSGEECDDGNSEDGDTCNAQCKHDADGDGVPDAEDNCPSIANADQADSNATLIGDACEGPPGYVFCANQGERCEFEGTASVAFGNQGSYIYAYNVANGIQCDNPDPIVGGDPLPDQEKSCYYRPGECVPACDGKACGDNACGGSCGSCPEGWLCTTDQSACDIDPNQRFHLKSQFLGDGMCLESNDRENGTAHDGFSFMVQCSGATGEQWKFVEEGAWYRLKSQFLGDGMCLESNNPDNGDLGAAFMDDCQDVQGQLWQLVPDGSWYRLKSQFLGDGMCLESNDPTNTEPGSYGGNAFMDDCQNVSGQLWQLVPY